MCQVAAPPAVFFAGPLQVPQTWLVLTAILAGLIWVLVLPYRRSLRSLTSRAGRVVGLALLACTGLASLTGGVILGLVVLPTYDARFKWLRAQGHQLEIHHCPAGIPLYATFDHVMNGDIMTWQHIGFVFLGIGFGAELLWGVWGVWGIWFTWRTRAHTARQ